MNREQRRSQTRNKIKRGINGRKDTKLASIRSQYVDMCT